MIIDIKQSESNKSNSFDIYLDNRVIRSARTAKIWVTNPLPIGTSLTFPIRIFNEKNKEILKSKYFLGKNVPKELSFYKFIAEIPSVRRSMLVLNSEEKEVAIISEFMEGIFKPSTIIKVDDCQYIAYRRIIKNLEIISIFDYKNKSQVAAVIKPGYMINNKDNYKLFLSPTVESYKDIFILYVIYHDYQNHANHGRARIGKSTQTGYSSDRNAKFVNTTWIEENFNKELKELMLDTNEAIKQTHTTMFRALVVGLIGAVIVAAAISVMKIIIDKGGW